MIDPPRISGVCERDIDLLLLEELWVNAVFRAWFIARATGSVADAMDLFKARRSVTQSSGESDIEVAWRGLDGADCRLLIENKVDAGFQRDQAARYRQRADDYVASGQCAVATTVLVAPAAYFGSVTASLGFDGTITYEQINEWFKNANLGPRGTYKASVLASAIEKSTLGYNPVADDAVGRFWRAYWEVSLAEAPQLAMPRPGGKVSGSSWIYFAPSGLPPDVWLVHKLNHGCVDLTFGGRGQQLGDLRILLNPVLESGMLLERTGKSSSVRILVPLVNIAREVSSQRVGVSAGLAAAARLLAWASANGESLASSLARRPN